MLNARWSSNILSKRESTTVEFKICHLDSIEYKSHEHKNSFLEKNLRWYSLVGVWLTMALIALVYNELKWLIVNSSIGFWSLSSNSRKFLSLRSDAWKDIFYWERMESHSYFLQ